ncbi:MAG: hypothetical protein FJ011_04675 [Chloroflexi bacterium]|nr:hypothetical protein [Chloroflexota bacterium]
MSVQSLIEHEYAVLLSHPVVQTIELIRQTVNRLDGYLRARCTLRNGDFLEVALHVTSGRATAFVDDYRYQWMDGSRAVLRRRWDNTPHFLSLPGAPYHCHIGEHTVEPTPLMDLTRLLDSISSLIGL